MLVVDYSWAHPDPAKIAAAGYVGVMRYLSIRQDTKVLGGPERDALHAQGLGIGLVWQTTATEVREGAAVGLDRRSRAEDQADALGYPLESPIFHAVDYDAQSFDEVRPYFEAVCDRAVRPVGLYGSARVVEQAAASGLPIEFWWQCAAWSRGVISPLAHLFQRVGFTSEARRALGTTDENRLYQPLPLWLPGGLTMWSNPVVGRVTSEFGPRDIEPSPHLGIDIAAPVGTPIRAMAAGTVVAVNTTAQPKEKQGNGVLSGRTGRAVLIDHGNGIRSYVGHCADVSVKVGTKVSMRDVVARVGVTGNTTGPHAHIEIHVSGTPTNPRPFLKSRGVTPGVDPYSVAYIKDVQTLLNTVSRAGLLVDGDLGPRTITAVENFQRSKGLRVDGDPGPITLRALRDATIPPMPPEVQEDPIMSVADIVEKALAQGEEGVQDAGWVESRLVDVAAALARVEARLDAHEANLAEVTTTLARLAAVQVGGGTVDLDALAARVADVIAARLAG